jgi:TPR repeat protein
MNCKSGGFTTSEEAIKMIVDSYGAKVFTEKKRLLGLLSDYLISDIKTKKLFANAVKENIPQKLYDIKDINENDREIGIAKIKTYFKEDNGMEESIANSIVDCFTYGLGWNLYHNGRVNTSKGEGVLSTKYEHLTLEQCLQLAANNDSSAFLRLSKIYYEGASVSKDLNKSFDYALKAAVLGNAEAMHDVGFCYQYGEGVKQDISKAYDWYVKSKDLNFNKAYYRLGCMYEDGIYVSLDLKKAMEYYLISARANYPKAMFAAGYMYGNGKGVETSYEEAFIWYEKAAKLNHVNAMYNLGVYYANGYGVQKNETEAFKWYMIAAEKNDSDAQYKVSYFFRNGIGTEASEEKELLWLKKSAQQNHRYALLVLGKKYFFGTKICPKDLQKAKECYMKVIEKGYADQGFTSCCNDAHFDLAVILLDEKPINEKTYQEILTHLSISGEHGELRSQTQLAKAYKNGVKPYIKRDIKLAYYWYEKAAENGDGESQYLIGRAFHEGIYKTKNYKQAVYWLEKSAAQNNPKAITKLGTCYMYGQGVTADIKKAIALFEKAIEMNFYDAEYHLGCIYNDGMGSDRNLELAKKYLESAESHNIYDAVEELKKNFKKKSDGTWVKKFFR